MINSFQKRYVSLCSTHILNGLAMILFSENNIELLELVVLELESRTQKDNEKTKQDMKMSNIEKDRLFERINILGDKWSITELKGFPSSFYEISLNYHGFNKTTKPMRQSECNCFLDGLVTFIEYLDFQKPDKEKQ